MRIMILFVTFWMIIFFLGIIEVLRLIYSMSQWSSLSLFEVSAIVISMLIAFNAFIVWTLGLLPHSM